MEKDKETKNKIAHTYTDDMADVIQSGKEGLVKKIIHGEEKHEIEKRNLSPRSKKNKFFLITGIFLIVTALTTLLYFYYRGASNAIIPERQFTPIIFNDKSAFIEINGLSKAEITQSIINEIQRSEIKDGGLEGIYLSNNKKMVGLREFSADIKSNLVLDESTTPIEFVSNNFLLGFVNNNTKDFFILLKMRSMPDIFEVLRGWEAKMFLDLHEFFEIELSNDTKYLLTKEFTDHVVENKNARVLYDQNGGIVMMYVFADDTSVIITDTEAATREIILRLASSRIKK